MLLKLIVDFLNPKSFTLSYKLKSIKKNYRAGEEPLKLTFNLQGVDLKQEDIMDYQPYYRGLTDGTPVLLLLSPKQMDTISFGGPRQREEAQ